MKPSHSRWSRTCGDSFRLTGYRLPGRSSRFGPEVDEAHGLHAGRAHAVEVPDPLRFLRDVLFEPVQPLPPGTLVRLQLTLLFRVAIEGELDRLRLVPGKLLPHTAPLTEQGLLELLLCGTATADFSPLGVALDYQRLDPDAQTSPVTVDVLFLYSAQRARFDAPSRIDDYMREANDTFRNSGTGITLRLAAAEPLPAGMEGLVRSIEEGTRSNEHTFTRMNNVLQILSRGIGTSDIESIRSRTRADLVVLWTNMIRHDGAIRALGLALQPGPRFAFSAEKGFSILAGNLTQTGLLAHEIGHNLGLAHPRSARESSDDPYLPHGQGYASGGYGTVMAYNTPAARYPLGVFSRDGFYRGRRAGDSYHRAAEAAAVGAQMVADYQRSTTPTPDPEPDPEPDSSLTSCRGGTCLLHDERFRIRVRFALPGMSAMTASGFSVGESAALHVFGGDGPELLTRVVDECASIGYWTFYAGSATETLYSVAVRDTTTGELRRYSGRAGASVRDLAAFRCEP